MDPKTLARVSVARTELESGTEYLVRSGKANAGKRLLLAAVFSRGNPDPSSEDLYPFYEDLFRKVGRLALGGVANDEWGYGLSIEYRDGLYYVESFPYSGAMVRKYAEAGFDLDGELLYFGYAPLGDEGHALRVINRYVSGLRAQMKENNDWFYQTGKKYFGENAFIGVHPTLWGDPADFSLDTLHNGLDWWEVRRDYAQTDEFVLLPIRLALAHKWGGTVWYNMWYSAHTELLDTYWAETWNSARFGGRTHYLGYECPEERGAVSITDSQTISKLGYQFIPARFSGMAYPFWKKLTTAGRAAEGLRSDWRSHLGELQREIGFEYIRFHGIFHDDMMIYHEREDGTPYYNWQYYDNLVDFRLETGIRPFLELSFTPSVLASGPKPSSGGRGTPPRRRITENGVGWSRRW